MDQEIIVKKSVFHTIESIRKLFAENGYILVSTEYKPKVKLQFICDKKHEGIITLGSFIGGTRCYNCGIEKIRDVNKTPFIEIKNEFILNNCILITPESEYKDKSTILEFTCSQNHINKSSFNSFKKNINKCSVCKPNKKNYPTTKKQITLQYAQEICDEKNFNLISTECKGCKDELEYLCDKGHKNVSIVASLRKINPCKECNGTLPITIESIKRGRTKGFYIIINKIY